MSEGKDLRNQIEGEHYSRRSITALCKAAVLTVVESTYSTLMILTEPDWAAIRSRGAYPVLKFSLLPVGPVINQRYQIWTYWEELLAARDEALRTEHLHTGRKGDHRKTKGPTRLSAQQGARKLLQQPIETAALSPNGSLYIWPVRSALV